MGPALIGLFVLVYVVLAVIALRRPLLARLAYREATRRPWQSALVVAGLTVGTSMILMALVNGDSMSTTLSSATYKSWGRVDILATNNGKLFSPGVASSVAADPRLHGKVRGVQGGVEAFAWVADLDRTLDNPAVRVIGFDPGTQQAFGAFKLGDGGSTFGQDLSAGQVLLSKSLADSLQARPGDRLTVSLGQTPPTEYRVAGIANADGPGAYGGGIPALFGTLKAMVALIGSDRINVVRISALGDGSVELDNSKAIAPAVGAVLRDFPEGAGLHVRTVKADDVSEITKLAADNTPLVMALSFIVVLAGIALVVNLSLALAEERRPRLAILRALGLSRTATVVAAVLEGAIYSLAAAAIGAVPGIATGWLLVSQAGNWVPEIHEKNATVLIVVSAEAIAVSVAAGTLITLTTLLVAAMRTTRMSIASAVRALPDPQVPRRPSRFGTLSILTLGVAGPLALVLGNTLLRILGGLAAITFIGLLLRGRMPNRWRATVVGVGAAAWLLGLYSTAAVGRTSILDAAYITMLTIACMIAALSLVVGVNMRLVERVVPRSLIAQLTRNPSRLALATGALGLVLAMLAFIGVFLASISPDYQKDAGGYDVSVASATASSIALPTALETKVESRMSLASRTYLGPVRSSTSQSGAPTDWHQQLLSLYELSPAQLNDVTLPFVDRDPRFSSDAAAWAAVRAGPNWVASGLYSGGATVSLIGSNGPLELRVAGHFRTGFLAGVMGSASAMTPFSSAQPGMTELIKLRPGVEPGTFALDVRRKLFPTGVEAVTTRAQLEQGYAPLRDFSAQTQLMLTAGLGVGVLSLGMLALRAVVDRRRSIGVLRAIGFQPRHVLVAVIGESMLTATGGVVVGLFVGLTLGIMFAQEYLPGVHVGIQAWTLVVAAVLIYATAAAVTVAPALAMARTAPAEALRIID